MSLVAAGGIPLMLVGTAGKDGTNIPPLATSTLIDAANEACIMIGQIWTEDGGSHTIDTTGSSSLGWRSGAVTSANAGTTIKVGLAAVDTAAGPAARAVNVANVITFDVSKTLTGAGIIAANSWVENVPDAGTKTIANGDLVAFCVQMTALGGADAFNAQTSTTVGGSVAVRPTVTGFVGGSYTAAASAPNAVITFSDGTLGFFFGGSVYSTLVTSLAWNSGSATKEYGNYFSMPFPGRVYGIAANVSIAGDADLVLYSDPLGTPNPEKTVSVDLNTIGISAFTRYEIFLFASPYDFTANQPLAGIIKPTSVTNVTAPYTTFNASAHQKAYSLGANAYAVNRAAGAFAAQNSNLDRFNVGLIVGAFDTGGGTGGISRARAAGGW